jgi:hypothetical protein
MSRRSASILILALAAAVLTGCAADPVVSPSSEPPSSSPTPAAEPAAVKPDTAFPLTCADIDLKGIENALGRELPLLPNPQTPFGLAAAHQEGSVQCSFGDGGADRTTYMFFTGQAHPVGASDPLGPASCYADQSHLCTQTVEVSGMRLYAYLQFGAGLPAPQAAFTAMMDAAVAQATERGRPADWVAPEGAAPAIFDCTLLSGVDVAGAVGAGPLTLADTTNIDEGMAEPLPRDSVAGGGRSVCTWYGGDTRVSLNVLSGGAWLADEATSLVPSEITGADLAFRQCVEGFEQLPCGVVAMVGLDALLITVGSTYAPTAMTEADAIAVTELIVPAFAAL